MSKKPTNTKSPSRNNKKASSQKVVSEKPQANISQRMYNHIPLNSLFKKDREWRNRGQIQVSASTNKSIRASMALGAKLEYAFVRPKSTSGQWQQMVREYYQTYLNVVQARTYGIGSLEKYIVNLTGIETKVNELKRAYEIINSYDSYDSHSSASLAMIAGIDYDTWYAAIDEIYDYLVNVQDKLHALYPNPLNTKVRADISRYSRYMYADSTTQKPSYYCPTCTNVVYYDYSTKKWTAKSFRDAISTSVGGCKWSTFKSALNALISNLETGNQVPAIATDTMRIFGDAALYQSEYLGLNQRITPQYDVDMLITFQNGMFFSSGRAQTDASFNMAATAEDVDNFGANLPYYIDIAKSSFLSVVLNFWDIYASERMFNLPETTDDGRLTLMMGSTYDGVAHDGSSAQSVAVTDCAFLLPDSMKLVCVSTATPSLIKWGKNGPNNLIAVNAGINTINFTVDVDELGAFAMISNLASDMDYCPRTAVTWNSSVAAMGFIDMWDIDSAAVMDKSDVPTIIDHYLDLFGSQGIYNVQKSATILK